MHLARLVELFNPSLYHYLLSLSDKELAEDVLQSTWLKVMKHNCSTSAHVNVKGWLFTIARNTLMDELKRLQRWQWQTLEDEHLASESANATLENRDKLARFNQVIEQLPFYQREAFIFQQEGFSVAEICQITHENFETVKSRLRYARKQLKTALGQEHD